ncbi:molecular chaperone HtpG [Chthonobacter rhizosphaerae]|uniref:molecular chaperone HtpG n=1 Tax=Chthonobacter rhizosphaerae TaxID=2735553 RepID=UPI0015EFC08A|nr:molecular chaperone HtpG [Chthonobacter rhizosphaerae]
MTTIDSDTPAVERHAFEAEVSRLLHLMVHAVYSDKDIFLRELVSNAADACEKLRYLSLADTSLLAGDDSPLAITIAGDAADGRLVVADNGIGMSHDELKDNLGTIARSGTRAFLDSLKDAKEGNQLIGQFGVGFYSAFMVAERVRVVSRKAGTAEAFAWESDGKGTFQIAPVPLDEAPVRGTRVELFLLDDAKAYAEEHTIERIVRAYSAHVPVPIRYRAEGAGETRDLADGSALWVKPKASVTPEEYREFYGHVGGMFDEPALTLHYRAEGRHEYAVLLFVPSQKPFDLFDPSRKGRVKLYVRRVFITDEAEILPGWLRFVRGVIDSEDLPLNLSREMLQKNPVLEAIGKGVTSRVLSELTRLSETDAEAFAKVWDAFGPVLKEGLYEAPDRRDDLFKVARFRTTTSGDGWRGLAEVVKDLKENQTALYYALGETREQVLSSPHLEGYKARGIEVLILTDPVDAFWVRTALGFDGKPFKSVTQGSADLDAIPLTDPAAGESADAGDVAALVTVLKDVLGNGVADVRASARLASSPVCLVASDFGLDKMAEKLMARHEGRDALSAPVLEINPRHGLIKALAAKASAGDSAVRDAAPLLLGQARILDGEAPDNPAAFAAAVADLMEKAFG